MRHTQSETKCKPKNKTRWFVEAYKHVLQFLSVSHALELQSVSFISRTVSNIRNVKAISICSHRGISNENWICQEYEWKGRGRRNQPSWFWHVASYSHCEHLNRRRTMSLTYLQVVTVEFRTDCQEHEWKGRGRQNKPSWLWHVTSYSYCEHLNRRSTMSLTYLHVVTVEFRTDCHFVTEYARKMNEKAGEGETNLRGFDMWPVTVIVST